MNWTDFLKERGADISNDHVVSFGNPAAEANAVLNTDVIFSLSTFMPVQISGNDAESFLHGQFTCDIKSLTTSNFLLCGWCNPKGQVIAIFYILRNDYGFLILVPENICDSFIQRLRMYILRSDVIIANRNKEIVCMGIRINENSNDNNNNYPAEIHTLTRRNNYYCLRVMDAKDRFMFVGSIDELKELWLQYSNTFIPVGTGHWHTLDILAGIPWINSFSNEQFLPQYLNLDKLNSINFDKGCFPGQEVIARLRYRGKVKYRLYLASMQQKESPIIGEELILGDDDRSIGKIIDVAPHAELGVILLAVMEIQYAFQDNIKLKTTGTNLEILSLPYSVI